MMRRRLLQAAIVIFYTQKFCREKLILGIFSWVKLEKKYANQVSKQKNSMQNVYFLPRMYEKTQDFSRVFLQCLEKQSSHKVVSMTIGTKYRPGCLLKDFDTSNTMDSSQDWHQHHDISQQNGANSREWASTLIFEKFDFLSYSSWLALEYFNNVMVLDIENIDL